MDRAAHGEDIDHTHAADEQVDTELDEGAPAAAADEPSITMHGAVEHGSVDHGVMHGDESMDHSAMGHAAGGAHEGHGEHVDHTEQRPGSRYSPQWAGYPLGCMRPAGCLLPLLLWGSDGSHRRPQRGFLLRTEKTVDHSTVTIQNHE